MKDSKPQTLLIRDTEVNTVNKKKNALQKWSEYNEKRLELQDVTDNDSGEEFKHVYKPQNDMLNHHMV